LSAKICVSCVNNSHCSDPTPACDYDSKTCVECIRNSDCDDPTPFCDTENNTCKGCLSNENCSDPEAPFCGNADVCVQCDEDS